MSKWSMPSGWAHAQHRSSGLEQRLLNGIAPDSEEHNGAQPLMNSCSSSHSPKGMEFERAIIIGAGADEIPAAWQLADLPASEQHDVELRGRSLLYVAATRAELVITWAGGASEYLAVPS